MEKVVDELVYELTKTLKNLKKSPNRRFLEKTLQEKLAKSLKIYNKLVELLEFHPSKDLLLIAIRDTYGQIKAFIQTRIDLGSTLTKFKTVGLAFLFCIKVRKQHLRKKMEANIELIKVISSLVPSYDGTSAKLNSVVSALTALNTLITPQNRALAIQVILSKLEGKARSAVGNNPADLQVIIDKLKEKCDQRQQPDVIIAKMNTAKQVGELSKFTDELERLTLELERAYISEEIPVDTATKMATKAAVKALSNGIKNTETKLILKAGQFTTLSEAIGKAAENESNEKQADSKIFKINQLQNTRGQNNPRGSYSHRGTYSTRGHYGYRGNTRYNNQNNRSNPRFQNNRYNWRGGFGNRGRALPPRQAHMFMAQQQEQLQPQHQPQVPQELHIPNQNHPLGVRFGQHTP